MERKAGNQKGLTLVEIMLAIGLFGIVLVSITTLTKTGSHIFADQVVEIRMMEVARTATEHIKAGKVAPWTEWMMQKPYALTCREEAFNGGTLLRVIVVPEEDMPYNEADPNRFEVVVWLP